MNRALAAGLAQQAKLIERSRALVLHPQANRYEKETFVKRNGGERIAPAFLVEDDSDKVAVGRFDPELGNQFVGKVF